VPSFAKVSLFVKPSPEETFEIGRWRFLLNTPFMNYWLMKTEPSVFSFKNLTQAPKRTTGWEGVRNYQARNLMRDVFQVGDRVLIYHSGIEIPEIAGVATVVREGYPDTSAFDKKSPYYDDKAKKESPWIQVDVQATHLFQSPVTRESLKAEPSLKGMMVLKKGARLSVQPVSPQEFEKIFALGRPKKL
jgi:predicted RNA-binding protein with PUA-like domain